MDTVATVRSQTSIYFTFQRILQLNQDVVSVPTGHKYAAQSRNSKRSSQRVSFVVINCASHRSNSVTVTSRQPVTQWPGIAPTRWSRTHTRTHTNTYPCTVIP